MTSLASTESDLDRLEVTIKSERYFEVKLCKQRTEFCSQFNIGLAANAMNVRLLGYDLICSNP